MARVQSHRRVVEYTRNGWCGFWAQALILMSIYRGIVPRSAAILAVKE